jgi:hypothetical protein
VMWVMWKLVSICLETVLISTHDRCMVRIEYAIGSKIVMGAPDGTPRWGKVEAHSSSFGDSVNLDAR